ncbi:hypothetical protein REPUB_Repub15cG0088800 [Reevesia pubescens]
MKHHSTVISMCKQMMGFKEIQPDISTMNTLINCFCNLKHVDLGFSVLDIILKLGLQPDPYTMNALLCNEEKNENGSFQPDVVCYNTTIDGFCKDRHMDKALFVFKDMLHRSIQPNVVTFTSYIHGFGIIGQWDEAKSLLTDMINRGISPDLCTFNALIVALCKDGKI